MKVDALRKGVWIHGCLVVHVARRGTVRGCGPSSQLLGVPHRYGLFGGDIEVEPSHPPAILAQVPNLLGVPIRQGRFGYHFENVPDGKRRDHRFGLNDLGIVIAIRHIRLMWDGDPKNLAVFDQDTSSRRVESNTSSALSNRVGQILPEAVPTLPRPAGVRGHPGLFVVHLSHPQVVAC